MTLYHVWFNLKAGVADLAFVAVLERYLDHLRGEGRIAGARLTRRQLGLGPKDLPEFHLMIEVEGLAQLEDAFVHVSSRAEPVESLHHAVNSQVQDVTFALYRDFPDPWRQRGDERF